MSGWFRVFFLSTIINGVLFTAIHRGVLGGDALNGYIRNGQHYVCYAGDCYRVSKITFIYSYIHTWVTVCSVLGVFLIPAVRAIFPTSEY